MTERNEIMRQLIDRALACGKKRQSAQTGYIHVCYSNQDDEPHLTIPTVENFLFALALLRSRTIENINEAKVILDALLPFQNNEEGSMSFGNFPIYLHEYPACKDRFIGLHVAVVVYWILKQFHQILGPELKTRLEQAFSKMVSHCIKTHREKAAPYAIAIKIAAVAKMGGALLQKGDIEEEGSRWLEQLRGEVDRSSWFCPATMGAILTALTMVYPRISESPWGDFWKHLQETWHRKTCTYIGPAWKESQQRGEPQVTLYDLFMGYFCNGLSARALKDALVHLEAVLIIPCDDSFQDLQYPLVTEGAIGAQKWHMYHGEHLAYSFIEKCPDMNPATIKSFHPLRIVWGDQEHVHTFVCQGGNSKTTEFTQAANGVDVIFQLGEAVEVEDKEKSRETIFYFDMHNELDLLISGQKANTFSLGEEVLISSGSCALSLTFHLEEGDGRFKGHLMPGNRPSQLALKGKNRFDAYDWQVFMRTMQRSELCIVRASLRILNPKL